jgi:acetolactate synthase-1/3 small subunit
MTIQTVGDAKVLEQIEKQLHKLVDVLRVSELGQGLTLSVRSCW